MMKGLKEKLCEEQVTWSVHPGEEKTEGRPHCSLCFPHGGKWRDRHGSLLSGDQCQDLAPEVLVYLSRNSGALCRISACQHNLITYLLNSAFKTHQEKSIML